MRRMGHILGIRFRLRSFRRSSPIMADPIIFDFTRKKVYRSNGSGEMARDLLRVVHEIVSIRKRIRLTVGDTPAPDSSPS